MEEQIKALETKMAKLEKEMRWLKDERISDNTKNKVIQIQQFNGIKQPGINEWLKKRADEIKIIDILSSQFGTQHEVSWITTVIYEDLK